MPSINARTAFCIVFFAAAAFGIAVVAQSPAPGPAGPPNITAILEKGGQFQTLMRLMDNTQVADQINSQLNDSNNAMTIFAATDNAFSSLSPGTLNGLSDQDKVNLIHFHILPQLISLSQFQTVSNPLRTQGGDSGPGEYPLNVTSIGSTVNISTGVVNTTISGTVYSDSQLAVYQVDKVLLPMALFGPKVPAAAPALTPTAAKKKKSSSVAGRSPTSAVDNSAQKWQRGSTATAGTAGLAAVIWLLTWS